MAKRPLRIPDRSEITDDTPLRLEVAAVLAYPDGSTTASGLRRERDAGRLVTELTASKEYTTLRDIGRMREACRELRRSSGPAYSTQSSIPTKARREAAQAAALQVVEELKRKRPEPPADHKPPVKR